MSGDCERFEDGLAEYVTGDLSGPGRRELEAHLERCRDCAAALDVVRAVRAASVPAPAGLEARIRGAVHAALDGPVHEDRVHGDRAAGRHRDGRSDDLARARAAGAGARGGRRSWRPWAVPLAAAAALAVVWVGLEVVPDGPPDAGDPEEVALATESYVPVGAWPAGGGEVAGEPLLSELTTEQLEQLLEEMGS